MRSVKVKLISLIAMICLVAGIMLVGIFAAQTQQIKLNGQVNFEIADKSLYVKDVRLQADMNSEPESISTFMPGYVNGEFNMNLGNFTNTYGSFDLYFDIINIVDETSGETFAYTASSSTTQGGVTVTTTILDNNGSSISQIPQGTVKPSEITSSTPISATIKITVGGTQGVSVDLSQITITINQYVQVYDYFDFEVNSDGKTVTLTSFDKDLAETTDIVIPATVSQNESGQWTDGNTYIVTDIFSPTSSSDGVFFYSGITSIELPSSLTSIGNGAFSYCGELTSITLPSSLTSIGGSAFWYCRGLTSITLPSSLTSIGRSAFSGCTNLQPSATDQGVKYLGNSDNSYLVLWDGMGITTSSYTINEKCKIICDDAFDRCSGLTSITFPSSLTSIGSSAFSDCSGLESIIVEEGNLVYHSADNCLIETESNTLMLGCKNSIIPSYITSIGSYAFYGCSGLTSISLPSTLTSIGSYAFYGCSGLTSISLPSTLTSIGNSAFSGCSGLTGALDLSNCTSLTSIGGFAFYNCSNLDSITFPNTTGWYATTSSTATSGTPMDMSNPTQNATWLTDTYDNYYFKRNA